MSVPVYGNPVPVPSNQIFSTAQLTPDGIGGYAKSVAALISAAIVAVLPFLSIDSELTKYLQIAVAVLGVIAVYGLPNKVKPPVAPPDPEDAANAG